MARPLAYFLTWTCYGTWLHGDPRGSVDAAHNEVGAPRITADTGWSHLEADRMTGGTFALSREARAVVEATIRRHCEIRGWRLWAVNVRVAHVHVVVDCDGAIPPEETMEQFKAWATRRLREKRMVGEAQRVWTEHGSTRWIDPQESLARAVDYVMHEQ